MLLMKRKAGQELNVFKDGVFQLNVRVMKCGRKVFPNGDTAMKDGTPTTVYFREENNNAVTVMIDMPKGYRAVRSEQM